MMFSQKSPIIKGAFVLTATGFATRLIGFFYRVYLSQTFGEESVGLYQLIFPIYALGFSFTSAGIQTAISRCVASKVSLGQKAQAEKLLYTGMSISVLLSFMTTLIIQKYASFLSIRFLEEPRCEPLLIVMSYALPFAAVHSCICGYYLGLKQTKIPALSQLIEQSTRVLTVYILSLFFVKNNIQIPILLAVIGLVSGELLSSAYCIRMITFKSQRTTSLQAFFSKHTADTKEILRHSVPLTGNRILLNLLQSIEAISIPLKLQTFGLTVSESLSMYGVLTGMALPCILFPSAATNAVATMLLPAVAEIQTLHHKEELISIIKKVSILCFTLGIICCAFLLFSGAFIGSFLFGSELAGEFIITLAWMCPFLYTNSTLISIINGIGYTFLSFIFNACGLLIRIVSIFIFIPIFGIQGYLWGLLISQLFVFLCSILFLKYYLSKQ